MQQVHIQDGFALMIQLGRVLGGVGCVGRVGNIPTTFIQLAGAGSNTNVKQIFKSSYLYTHTKAKEWHYLLLLVY